MLCFPLYPLLNAQYACAPTCSANAVCKPAPESSSQVTRLSVAGNCFGPNGGIAFAKLLEQAYSTVVDTNSWPRLQKLDLSSNYLGSAGERGPQSQPPPDVAAAIERQTKGEGTVSPPASPAVSPGRRTVATGTATDACRPSEHRLCAYSAGFAKVSQMTDDELRRSIEQRKRRAAACRGGAASGRTRQHRSTAKPAWGFSTLANTASVVPQRFDESMATLRDDDSRPAGRALNSCAGPAPTNDCEPPPSTDFVSALRGAMRALRSAAASAQGLRAIKIDGNGLGRHTHELLNATSVTFRQPGTIGLELLPDRATGGKNGIEVRAITRRPQTGANEQARDAEGMDQVKIGMLLQSVAGVPVEKAAGSTAQRFRQVIGMIKAAARPMTLTFVHPADTSGHWHRQLDGWLTTANTKATDPEFRNKFSTAEEIERDATLWRRRQEQVEAGVRIDEARVQRIRHELMARLPASLGYITPTPADTRGEAGSVGWARKSLQQLRRVEQVLSRHDDSIAALDSTLRAEAELIGSGLRSIDDVPLQYAGKVPEPHRGYHHRFIKDQTDKAAEMLLTGLNSTDLSMTQLPVRFTRHVSVCLLCDISSSWIGAPACVLMLISSALLRCGMRVAQPSRFGKGEGGRFDLLENRARQIATRIAAVEAKAAAAQAEARKQDSGGGARAVQPATGLLKWRDPRTGELHQDRH